MIDDAGICQSLRAIVARTSADPALQDDLMQECLVRLWKLESTLPKQTKSWYLQNCRFHVHHCLAAGKSIDSLKRSSADKRITIDLSGDVLPREDYHTNGETFNRICAQDLLSTLSTHLQPLEKSILHGLAQGMALREVAARLKLSYPTALKYRRRIADLAVKLGVAERGFPANRRPGLAEPQPYGASRSVDIATRQALPTVFRFKRQRPRPAA